jgi:hypothetical protein
MGRALQSPRNDEWGMQKCDAPFSTISFAETAADCAHEGGAFQMKPTPYLGRTEHEVIAYQ